MWYKKTQISYSNQRRKHIPELEIQLNENGCEVYVCSWKNCAYESSSGDEIARHVNYHSFHAKLQCIGTNIRSRINLPKCNHEISWKNIVNAQLPHTCEWDNCLKVHRNYQLFLYHVFQHVECNPRGNNVEGGIKCKWTGCKRKFPSVYKLKSHVRHHTKEKIVACPDCGVTFASNTKFHDHCRRQIPLDVQGFQCRYCSKSYPTEGILRDHMRFHVFNYKCSLCDMSCLSISNLVKHVRYRHLSERPFPCQLCSHAAKSQQDLDSHMTVHTSGPNFFCNHEGCTYTCKNASIFDRHIERAHTNGVRWYCCHECPIKYRKSYSLTKHLIEEHKLQTAGQKRFQYMRDDDGCYRLQIFRYEGVDEENSDAENSEVPTKNYKIKLNDKTKTFAIVEDNGESEVAKTLEIESEQYYDDVGKSMPTISNILISIDEMDIYGNIIERKIVETQETNELPPSEEPPIILT
ncbi:histone H4 transcription factor isoform X2 [Venturia canescens]|uniref:histone H4 transcription factor isoform X2 n=1 Tax=Venturia canescens TaxID=32260 RepID=UPI001C9BE497|nr:histone H4 transcription factor isoform X2 [Venturia canescens]